MVRSNESAFVETKRKPRYSEFVFFVAIVCPDDSIAHDFQIFNRVYSVVKHYPYDFIVFISYDYKAISSVTAFSAIQCVVFVFYLLEDIDITAIFFPQ